MPTLKRELLNELGQRKDAFESAWSEFKEGSRTLAQKAIEEVMKASLPAIIKLCMKTKEWEILDEWLSLVEDVRRDHLKK